MRGWLHRPASSAGGSLALTHGAGSNCEAPLLLALAAAFSGAGTTVLRFNLPFRQLRPHGPPRPGDAAKDREGIRAAAEALRKLGCERLFLAGHSYGGRQASMLAAVPPAVCDGLLLLSYPLHPPRRPEELRTAHFPKLHVPALLVHGTRDPFATTEELAQAMRLIPARTSVLELAGAGHDLAPRGQTTETAARIHLSFQDFFAGS